MQKRQAAKKLDVTASDKLAVAKKHLHRVQSALGDPTDWADLTLYGFYCLEAAIDAATLHLKRLTSTKHWEKVDTADQLHADVGLPHISSLLAELNDARKSSAYGDVEMPNLDAQDVATDVEDYVQAVEKLLSRTKTT